MPITVPVTLHSIDIAALERHRDNSHFINEEAEAITGEVTDQGHPKMGAGSEPGNFQLPLLTSQFQEYKYIQIFTVL